MKINNKNHINNHRGISTIELAIALVVLVVVFLGVSGVLANNQRLWNSMYNRTYSEDLINGQIAKKIFDTTIRKSSKDNLHTDTSGNWAEACYYANETSVQPDRYARFFYQGGNLYIEHGLVNPRTTLSSNIICSNVTDCAFRKSGRSVHMLMTINDGTYTFNVVSSAETHN